jgi:hypothetical protein
MNRKIILFGNNITNLKLRNAAKRQVFKGNRIVGSFASVFNFEFMIRDSLLSFSND